MRATISEVRFNGLVLNVEDGISGAKEMWLPSEEWSSNSSDWEYAKLALDPQDSEYELDVVPLSRFIDGRMVVSRKGVDVKTITDSSLKSNSGIIRDMRILDVGRTLIRGTIGDDTPAIVTYKNHQSYLDWVSSKELTQELFDHAVLGQGDMIRGFVSGISDEYDEPASVVLDISEYLDYRRQEIAEMVVNPNSSANGDQEEYNPPHRRIRPENITKISPVLLVDDNKCRVSIAKILEHEGVEVDTLKNSKEAQDFLDSLSPDNPRTESRYRLAILDPNLEEHSTDLIGLKIAAELRSKTECRVILMTGEIKNSNKLERWPKLGIHGYIEKPFTMEQLIDEIEDAVGLPEAVPLAKWIRTQEKSLPSARDIENTVPTQDPAEISIEEALQRLGGLKHGIVIHVFELHPRSFRARSLGSFAGDSLKWISLRGKIAKSVIKDAAVGGIPIVENNVNQNPSIHLWTLQMMKYQSFCGVPVYVKGKRVALVAFHPERQAFDNNFVMLASLTAEKVGRAIERKMLYETRRNEAELASFGMALASLAHELASDMTALDANLKELGNLASDNLEDLSKKGEALDTLERIRGDVDVISTKTRILRRAHASSDKVSIIDCLKKAATACRTVKAETINHHERILIKGVEAPPGTWNVNASMASLIIVFFNLYLNAAQQIDLASSVRRHGVIWNTLTRFEDAKGKAWARVRIHDSGPGIHHDDWERVFEPGYSTKPNGSGLGLYICRYLLQDISQASLTVTSSVIWDGTTVTVDLPLADDKTLA